MEGGPADLTSTPTVGGHPSCIDTIHIHQRGGEDMKDVKQQPEPASVDNQSPVKPIPRGLKVKTDIKGGPDGGGAGGPDVDTNGGWSP